MTSRRTFEAGAMRREELGMGETSLPEGAKN